MNSINTLALSSIGGPEIFILFILFCVYLVIAGIPAVLAFLVLSRIPPEHQKQTPGLAFLLLIPLFSLVWMFFVHPKVAESLKSYFNSIGDTSVGDCGASLALATCICLACAIIPLVGALAGLAGFVLLIIFYVKAFELSARISRPY